MPGVRSIYRPTLRRKKKTTWKADSESMQNTWELRSQYKSKMKWRRCFVYELIRCRNFNLLWLLVLITLICQLVGTAWNAEESTFGCDTLYTHPFLRKHPMHAVYLRVPTKINLELWKVRGSIHINSVTLLHFSL